MYILRGPSGAGKSTRAKELGISGTTLSTDEFWMKDGKYQHEAARLPEAHAWNQRRARECLKQGITPVIIDNTNIEAWQMKPYVHMAQEFGYQVNLVPVQVNVSAEELAARNKHGTPLNVIQDMLSKYDPKVTIRDILKSQPPEQKTANQHINYGEYWFIDGHVEFADGDIGEMNHDGHVMEYLLSSHNMNYTEFDRLQHCDYPLPNGSKDLFVEMKKRGFKQKEVQLLCGTGNLTEYALQFLGWKRVEHKRIETWTLTYGDWQSIMQGLNDIAQEDEEGTSLWDIEVASTRTFYQNIPLSIIEKGITSIVGYKSQSAFPMSLPNDVDPQGWHESSKRKIMWYKEAQQDLIYTKLNALKPQLVIAAQKVYDSWNVVEGEINETFGRGGICHFIADDMANVINNNIPGITASTQSAWWASDQHVATIVYNKRKTGCYVVDIYPYRYEKGGGFSWTKLPDIVFDNSDINIWFSKDRPEEY